MIKNITLDEIKNNNEINSRFINANIEKLNITCNIYKGNFYADSFNYFPINENFNTFAELFTRDNNQSNIQFFSNNFYENFKNNIEKFKNFNNVFLLGSNAGNNYYSNLVQFLPRIFLNTNKDIKIAIHRNSSIKFRSCLESIMKINKIKFSFVYLDDSFYSFINSEFPQFFDLNNSIKILKHFLTPKKIKIDFKKIYVTREDASYRKIINEADLIPIFISKGYKVINPHQYNINEQIEIFSHVDKIVSPHGSNLANIVFCKPKTEIFEIGPQFTNPNETSLENRYKSIASINHLKYNRIIADTVDIKNHIELAKKYINNNILKKSNYYKNLIVKVEDIRNLN